jgi:thymidine kinase
MAKLYFRFGTVGSAKTLNLLAVAHTYRQQGKEVLLLKPALDTRFGQDPIRSRAGLEKNADLLLQADTDLSSLPIDSVACILVDEVQFLQPAQIEQLRQITMHGGVPCICYGLRTDFRGRLFPGAQRLLELADSIEEIKMTCAFCHKKAIFSLKHVQGRGSIAGPSVDLGAEEKYFPVCARCYEQELSAADVPLEEIWGSPCRVTQACGQEALS